MSTYPVLAKIDGQSTFSKPLIEIANECDIGGALYIRTALEYLSDRQRNWYKGIALRGLSEWNGNTPEEWDYDLKLLCGAELLKRESIFMGRLPSGFPAVADRLTITGVGKRKMTSYIENILSTAITNDWPVTPPDPELRR